VKPMTNGKMRMEMRARQVLDGLREPNLSD
jgi:hypothetical protein